jgi:hypothetical protein
MVNVELTFAPLGVDDLLVHLLLNEFLHRDYFLGGVTRPVPLDQVSVRRDEPQVKPCALNRKRQFAYALTFMNEWPQENLDSLSGSFS